MQRCLMLYAGVKISIPQYSAMADPDSYATLLYTNSLDAQIELT